MTNSSGTIDVKAATIEEIPAFSNAAITASILRLDRLHPVVSGNKWFKLKYYLEEAKEKGFSTIASFGGAYSNHLVALAHACREADIHSVGFVRGEDGDSHSLAAARAAGMELFFVDRDAYKHKEQIQLQYAHKNWYWVDEGGYGYGGAEGAAIMLTMYHCSTFTHILCACGTGTTMAGLIRSSLPHQQIIGVSVLKNHTGLEENIRALLDDSSTQDNWRVYHDFHFGGYAKHPQALLDFMNDCWRETGIPTDIVYTGKLLYATKQLIQQNAFPSGSNILLIHSGGLQGNLSLPANKLEF